MKKRVCVLLLFSVIAGNSLSAQSDSAASKVGFMYVSLGFTFSSTGLTNAESMRKLAKDPSGTLLNEDLGSYFSSLGNEGVVSNIYPSLAAGMGIRLWNKKKGLLRKSTLRLSMRYNEFSPLSTFYSVDSISYAGTYYNTNNNFQPIVVNEVKHSSYSMNYHVSVVQVEIAQYFHTNEVRRISVYGGYALCLGASVFSRLEVSRGQYREYTQQQSAGQSGNGLFYHKFIDSDYEYDRYKANAAVTGGANLVMGAQLRFSKKNSAFGRLTYSMEFQPGINAFLVRNSTGLLIPSASCTSIIKYRF